MSIDKNGVSISEIEKIIYEEVCQQGCELFRKLLESLDAKLMSERDMAKLRHKGKRRTVLKTIMGEVEYERAVYKFEDDGKSGHVFLLDELLGFDKIGFISELLAEKIVEQCCEQVKTKICQDTKSTILSFDFNVSFPEKLTTIFR